jgi:hypothetical protein
MTGVFKPTQVRFTVKLRYEYGYKFLYLPPLKRALEHSKQIRNC